MVGALSRNFRLFIVLVLTVGPIASAQVPSTGRLTGTVSDPQDAVILGANILARNVRTGAECKAVSNETGVWTIPSVPTGSYEVSVRADHGARFILRSRTG